MRAGNLNKKITIQSLSGGVDEFGQPLDSQWLDFKSVRASIIPVSGKESFLSQTDFAKTTHRIKFRYISGVNASMRAVWNGRIFDFIKVRDISERNREIEVYAEEVING